MIDAQFQPTIESIARTLGSCRSIFFVTGAGVSADSGLPTYRGVGGLYNVDTTEDGEPIEVIMSSEMLARDPALTWKYLAEIGRACDGATYNRTHKVIAEMEAHFHRVWTLTQNVDGFHRSAGSENVLEAHGNMHSLSCTRCSFQISVDQFSSDQAKKMLEDLPPKCPKCDSLIRPDVILFGELLPRDVVDELQRQAEMGFDIVFSIGTSNAFPYTRAPIEMAKQFGIPTVEINPSETPMSYVVDYRLPIGAADALDAIWTQYQANQQ